MYKVHSHSGLYAESQHSRYFLYMADVKDTGKVRQDKVHPITGHQGPRAGVEV
jgi:hypothetical protein